MRYADRSFMPGWFMGMTYQYNMRAARSRGLPATNERNG